MAIKLEAGKRYVSGFDLIKEYVPLREKAEKGLVWLKENHENKINTINLDMLNMKSGQLCVLGQIFHNYTDVARVLGHKWCCDHGFDNDNDDDRNSLTNIWRDLLKDICQNNLVVEDLNPGDKIETGDGVLTVIKNEGINSLIDEKFCIVLHTGVIKGKRRVW